MQDSPLENNLSLLIHHAKHTLLILYHHYQLPIHITLFLLTPYLAYLIGKSSVIDPLETHLNHMHKAIYKRQTYTQIIPQKISRLQSFNKLLFWALVILAVAYITLDLLKHQVLIFMHTNILMGLTATSVALVVSLWFYVKMLQFRLNRGNFNDNHLQQRLNKMCVLLGSKVESILKQVLCKEVIKSEEFGGGVCSKDRCKEHRGVLREKAQCISELIDNVLNFDWCSVCRKALPFDEFLAFQAEEYGGKQKEESQVNDRNGYLMGEVQRMVRWCRQLGPCNCSMRYWNISRKQISQFKKRQKQIDQRLVLFEARKSTH